MRRLTLGAALVWGAACASAAASGLAPTSPTAKVEIDTAVTASASKALDDALVDYPSARFRSVTLHGDKGKRVLCGQLNTKNRGGGYGGWTNFRIAVDNDQASQITGLLVMEGTPTAVDRLLMQYGPGQPTDRDSSGRVITNQCGAGSASASTADYADAITFRGR